MDSICSIVTGPFRISTAYWVSFIVLSVLRWWRSLFGPWFHLVWMQREWGEALLSGPRRKWEEAALLAVLDLSCPGTRSSCGGAAVAGQVPRPPREDPLSMRRAVAPGEGGVPTALLLSVPHWRWPWTLPRLWVGPGGAGT